MPSFPRPTPTTAALAVALLTFGVFLPATTCDFVNWDDDRYVRANPLVLGGLSPAGIRAACTSIVFSNYAPLTILSYQLDATLWGTNPFGYHLTNVCLHAATTGLLCLALARMTGATGRAAVAAAVFGLHPLRVESVVWVAERKDVLSVLLVVVALVAYERFCRAPSPRGYAAVAAALAASLLAKATAVTLPVLLLLLDVWPLGRLRLAGVGPPPEPGRYPPVTARRAVVEKLPLLALAAVFAGITLVVHGGSGAMQSEEALPLVAARIPNAIYAWCWYLWKTLWPTGLQPHYTHVGWGLAPAQLAACIAVPAALAVLAVRQAGRRPVVPWGLAWFTIALAPVLGLVQTGLQGYGDRFTYVPHIGLVTMLVWLAGDAADRWRPGPAVVRAAAALVVALAAGVTSARIPMWRDSLALWTTVTRQDPANAMAHLKLANHLVSVRRPLDAEPHYRAAAACATPDWPGHVCRMTSLANLACLYHDLGDLERARATRDLALEIDPDDPAVRHMLEHVGR